MSKRSAGLLIFRRKDGRLEVLLVHPGGPFWAKKDAGAWSIPKGLVDDGEDELAAARREVEEEIGTRICGRFERLGEYKQRGGKIVIAWSVEADADIDVSAIASNTFALEWPPRSGTMKEFPEVDRAGWFALAEANGKILEGQKAILSDFAAQVAD
ncbi:NUDIX domain-containing protein [Aquamicrobium soli]|jgi:predicted NUDIX family NTP pyrophosphohydrolase|uniref:NUDIX domain-containing protein n=1 Tax=Aquamicrobium soli TaxID=1811518 RepID=A0ABV7K3H5_9HYPH